MSMWIANDVTRCAGRFGLGHDDPICPRREQCLRYRALLEHEPERPVPIYIAVTTGLCRDGEDYMIEGQA